MELPLIGYLGVLTVGITMLVFGGEQLVRGAERLALRMGIAPIVIGLTVVAFGTSAPELALNVVAAINGNSGLSYGNIIGSNVANIGLILGMSALMGPIVLDRSLVKRELPILITASIGLALMAWLPLGSGGIGRFEGSILLVGFVGFLGGMFFDAQRGGLESSVVGSGTGEVDVIEGTVAGSIGRVVVGLVLLAVGGKASEVGAVGAATALGVSSELIGLTIVAVATSLPELVTSIIAARRGQPDIAVGNVVGSNLFNILLVMGTTAVISPVSMSGDGSSSMIAMLVLTLVLIPISRTKTRRMGSIEGALLLVGFVAYIGIEIWRRVAG